MGIQIGSRGGRGRSSRRRGRRGVNADINVAPLVDVMLVLLIVFMISANILSPGVPVELPKTDANSLPVKEEPIRITVEADGTIFLQTTETTLDELVDKLVAISANGYDERIHLRADAKSSYEDVVKVMARINEAGFSNFGLETDKLTQ